MFHRHPHSTIPHSWRWLSGSVIALSAGGLALAIILDDDVLAGDCLPVAALPGLAAVIYWFNNFIYKINKGKLKDPFENPPNDKKGI